ncbi:MAG: HAD-IIA family hydrolase [Chloroflexota bacterium]
MDEFGPVRGALIDVDGVLHVDDVPVPGAPEALQQLQERGLAYTLLTNTTMRTRAALADKLNEIGFDVTAGEIITAAAATAEFVRREFPNHPAHLLVSGDTRDEFDGITLTDDEDEALVVVIGGAGPEFTFEAINRVYRMLRNGAALIAMHKSVSWMTSSGITVDSGIYVHGLEWAAGINAIVIGKPSIPFFQAGYQALDLPPEETVMISDSNRQDVRPAMALGSRGVLVRTGVFEESDLDAGRPHAVLDSFADVCDWLDQFE